MLNRIKETFDSYDSNNAFVIEDKTFTFSDLLQRVSGIYDRIAKQATTRNGLLGILTEDNIETYAAILASWLSGHGFVPIDPRQPVERNGIIIDKLCLTTVLSSGSPVQLTSEIIAKKIKIIDTKDLCGTNEFPEIVNVPDDSFAYVLFTSGSTGTPKGVPISRYNLKSYMDGFFHCGYEIKPEDKVLQMFNFTFDMSVMSYMIGLFTGACIHTVPSGGIKYLEVIRMLQEQEITIALKTPSLISYLRPYFNEIHLPKLKYSLFAGEALQKDIIEEWAKSVPNAEIHNIYGPTEAVGCWFYDCTPSKKKLKESNGIISIGKPYLNMHGFIIDDNGVILKNNEKGELCIAGSQLFKGYWDGEELNEKAFIDLPVNNRMYRSYRTGDICYIDNDGDFMFLGRKDDQIKIDGFRVELSEIEHHIKKILQDENVAVVAGKDLTNHTLVIAFIEKQSIADEILLKKLRKSLPSYMLPNRIIRVEALPLNANGKINRKQLLEVFKDQYEDLV